MRLLLVRHGQTAWHASSRHVGKMDIPLDETGKKQAKLIAERFESEKIDVIFSSPLSRCLEIAQAVASSRKLNAQTDERLAEMDLGEWSGKTYLEVSERYGNIVEQWHNNPASLVPPNGESLLRVRERVLSWVDFAWSNYTWSNIFVSSHSTPIRLIISELIGLPFERMFSFQLDLASVSIIAYNGALATLEKLNDTSHLVEKS